MQTVIPGSGLQPVELFVSQSPEQSLAPCPWREEELYSTMPSPWDLHVCLCPLRIEEGGESGVQVLEWVTSPIMGSDFGAFDLTLRVCVCVRKDVSFCRISQHVLSCALW